VSDSSRILVTGATGFVGRAVLRALEQTEHPVSAVVRTPADLPSSVRIHRIDGIGPNLDLAEACRGCGAVLHLAARVHVMDDQSGDPLAEYRRINVGGTTALARQAAAAGVRRFVYVSSIKVNGESTPDGQPFSETQVPAPTDPYGISKLEAEQAVFDVGASTGMEVVVVRPPLVYGAGVKANFLSMMKWLARGLPLPLGAIHHNRRSLVGLDNLTDFLITCLHHPGAANQVFVVSDGEDLSTTELLRRTARALGVPARLVPLPASLIGAGAAMLGKRSAFQRLCGSLQVDISKARRLLAWNPSFTVDEELRRATSGVSRKAVAQ